MSTEAVCFPPPHRTNHRTARALSAYTVSSNLDTSVRCVVFAQPTRYFRIVWVMSSQIYPPRSLSGDALLSERSRWPCSDGGESNANTRSCAAHCVHVKGPQVTKINSEPSNTSLPHNPIHSFTLFKRIVSNALVAP